jgi:S1-C subfamily serine protease
VANERRPVDDLINKAIHVVRSYLILYRSPANQLPAPFLQVIGVEEDSNASRVGIQTGDYLEIYDGKRPETIDALRNAIKAAEAVGKNRVLVVIYRGTERMEKFLGPGRMGVNLAEN